MKKTISLLVCLALIFAFSTPAFATSPTSRDLYAQEAVEKVQIEGIEYTYRYYYSEGNKVIDITNSANGNLERIVFDPESQSMYLNGDLVGTPNAKASDIAIEDRSYDWESLGKSSHYISWAEATSAAAVAGMIGVYLGGLGGAAVIAAMGMGALSVIVGSASGGTITVEMQCLNIPLSPPQYRYIWSFLTNTGELYGPYVVTVPQ